MDQAERKQLMTIFITALITSLMTLLLSPIAIAVGFWLNDHLARPILSVEYVEVIPEKKRFETPTAEIGKLMQSVGFQSYIRKGAMDIQTQQFFQLSNKKEGLSSEDISTLKESCQHYHALMLEREKQLQNYLQSIQDNPPESKLREIAMAYYGATAQFMPGEKDLDTMKNTLIAKIINGIKTVKESGDYSKTLEIKLSQYGSAPLEKIRLKLSVLNKGNTDALVRSSGDISFEKSQITIPIYQEDPPSKDNRMAVAVTIADEPPKPIGGISVGKIEKHTLKYFWYSINYVKADKGSQRLLNELIKGSIKYKVLIRNQNDEVIDANFI